MIAKVHTDCTGCRACDQICPVKCISMKADDEGFMFPVIDEEICIHCNKCRKICPANTVVNHSGISPKVYAAKLKDTETLHKSASGGIFAGIAQVFFEEDGHIFGAAYDNHLDVEHIGIHDIKDLHKLQGSKYVQSDTKDTYTQVKYLLEANKKVVYSGTPCQVAGLNAFLNKDYDNLLTVDLVCHGVPSPLLFQKYLNWLSKIKRSKVIEYKFRSKKHGWGPHYYYYYCEKSSGHKIWVNDPYYYNFRRGNTYRESCYRCKYANCNRISDLTIADYWGIEKHHPEFLDKAGVSVILVNTTKGEAFYKDLSQYIAYIKSSLENAIEYNGCLKYPAKRPIVRNDIYKDISEEGFKYIKKNLIPKHSLTYRIKLFIPNNVKKNIKKILGRI